MQKIGDAKRAGKLYKLSEPIRCLKSKLKCVRLSIDVEVSKHEKIDNVTRSRVDAAYESAAAYCIELKENIERFTKERETMAASNETMNETEIECVKDGLMQLKPLSKLLDGFDGMEDNDTSVCSLVTEPLIRTQKNLYENFYKASQLKNCTSEEFLQLDALKTTIFEGFLVKYVKISDDDFESFVNETTKLTNLASTKKISCLFKEIFE